MITNKMMCRTTGASTNPQCIPFSSRSKKASIDEGIPIRAQSYNILLIWQNPVVALMGKSGGITN